MPKKHITRQLRKNQTPWEVKMWALLKSRRFEGFKFRRQFKIGDYIVDFYCPRTKLIIELDGGHHNESNKKDEDKKRQHKLEAQGYKVLRFWNNELDGNIEGVVQEIIKNLL